jgi:hypothetical protein
MKYIYFLLIISLASSCYQSKTGSGKIITETRTTAEFNAIKVSSSIDVDVQQGNESSIVVEADDNIIRFVETEVIAGKLTIKLKDLNNLRNATIKVHVITKSLNEIAASSSSSVKSNGQITSTNKIEIVASSSASIDLQLDAPSVNIVASSSSEIDLAGRTRDLVAKASSSADINAQGLQAETANVSASSSSTVKVFASIKLDASASSSADVVYTGGAKDVKKAESSSGSIDGN